MSRKRRRRRGNIKSDMDLTNLIDVIFAILITFIITAPMMTQGVQVDLPKAEAKSVETDKRMIQVSISKENLIYIDEQEVSKGAFRSELKSRLNGDFDTPIFISGDKSVPYGFFIRVVTEIQKTGAVKLGFLTEPLPKEQ